MQGGCHCVSADEFNFDFVGGYNVYSFDDSCDKSIRVFSNMEVGDGQLEIWVCGFLLAGGKLVDLLLQAVDAATRSLVRDAVLLEAFLLG